MFGIGKTFKRYFGSLSLSAQKRELDRIRYQPRYRHGYTDIFGKPFKFNDGAGFYHTYLEIFVNGLYEFEDLSKGSVILDCGANMGLSVLYFARNYPHHQVVAFEPDPVIFSVLEENVRSFGLQNVTLYQRAVWDKEETLQFFTDQGMGGRVENAYHHQVPTTVKTVRLRDFITENVAFLKIDIEGAEDTVIRDCRGVLSKVDKIFFEYHNDIHKPQTLHELLALVRSEGFHYYIKESFARKRPFIDRDLTCENFDMAINIFCYRL